MAELKGKILAGKVLIEPQEAEKKTAGGLIIPDSAKEKPLSGKVVLVGGAKKMKSWKLKLVIWFSLENTPVLNLPSMEKITCL